MAARSGTLSSRALIMTLTYKLRGPDPNTGITPEVIIRTSDGVQIPKLAGNTDYQEYLNWVAEGNTAEAAD